MFQFRAFPAYSYLIQSTLTRYCRAGFPHSEISGSMRMCRSPELIAACRVLLRLLMPRHSPCALISLTVLVLRIMQVTEDFLIARIVVVTQFPQLSFRAFSGATLCCLASLIFFSIVQFSRCRRRSKTGSKHSNSFAFKCFDPFFGGDKRDRTADLLRAKQALSQLS